MKRRRTVGILLLLIGIAALSVGIVLAFSDTQSATGSVNATSASVDLYICEASEAVPGPVCAADDSAGDEIIFEGLEDLIPGRVAEWDIRLVNQGENPWDVLDFSTDVSIASDPGGDCGTLLTGDPDLGFAAVLPKQGIAGIPKAVAVNPATSRIYVTSGGGLSVIDGVSNTLVTTITFGGPASGVAVNPITNRVYVTHGVRLSVIDGTTNAVISQMEPFSGDLAVNPTTNRVYVSSSLGDISVIDGSTNGVIATVPVGSGQIGGIAVNSATNLVYVTDQAIGTVSVLDGSTNTKIATVSVGSIPGSVGADPATNRIYVKNGGEDSVSVIDGGTNAVVATINDVIAPIGTEQYGLAVNSNTNRVYVSDPNGNKISVIDGASDTVVAAIPLALPRVVSVDATANHIYTNDRTSPSSNDSLITIDGASNTVIATVSRAGSENDNHAPLPGFPTLPRTDSGTALSVHVGPGDYEDVRIFVMLAHAAPAGCSDTAWEVSVSWTAQIHSP